MSILSILLSGIFKCSITSLKLKVNTIQISCELLKELRRISVAVTYADCHCCQPITMIGDSPVVVSDLVAGQYIVEMAIADTTESDTIGDIITVSYSNIPINNTIARRITAPDICTSVTPTKRSSSEGI